jgi:hypothetical protein
VLKSSNSESMKLICNPKEVRIPKALKNAAKVIKIDLGSGKMCLS